jgi:formate hydrogenlyase transcriptional activator
MADSATAKELTRPGASFARRYGLAFVSVAGALLLDLLFHHFNLPHPFAAFALSAIAITFWYGGTKPGMVAVLLSSLIRGFIFEGETGRLSLVLYDLVFLTFAILMIWVTRRKEALEVAIVDRTAELTTANEGLLREKEQLDALFELSPDAVIVTDEDFHVLRVNKEFTRIFGYTADEVAGQWLLELIVPEELRAEAFKNRDLLISGNRVELEAIRQRKGGVRFDVSIAAKGISLGSNQVAVCLIFRDITERKKAESELRRSESYLAEAQSLSRTGSFGWSIPSGEVFWSEETFQIFQYDPTTKPTVELVFQRVYPEDAALVRQTIERASRDGSDFEHEYRLLMPDDSVKYVHAVAHASRNESGGIEFVGAVSDITERKQAEEKLRRSEADLLEAQRISHTGSWKHDVSSGTVTVSPEVFQIFDVKPDEVTSTTDFWLSKNHPDDDKRIRELFERSEIEKTDYEADYRIVLSDGSIKHIHAVGHPVLNDSGDLVEFVGTAMDVTERKQAEDKIRKQEVELRQILDAAPQHLSVLRGDGSHLYINQSSLDFLGLTLEKWQKSDIRELIHPDDAERVARERKQALSSGSPLEVEMRLRRLDGEYRWFFLHYKPLKDQLGHITRWVVPAIDIEDRKRVEERMRNENLALREQIDQAFMFEEIVGSSPALQTVLSSIVKVAPTDSTVLITGETGTGKELIARAIHKHSQRSGQAFISVNCASIPSSLIASELFGHEKGAFTGAVQRRQGRFELAHSGTIFLDEVGDLPAETQVTLLRVLQERQFERVGGNRVLTTDVRVIAATNRDLTAAIAAGTFRSDLFYRFNVFPIEVPPLRKRKEDIPMLLEYFVKRYAEKVGKQIRQINTNTLELCQAYLWPGNIRELQNIVERSVILSNSDTFRIEEAWLASPEPASQELISSPLPNTLQNQEREIIEAALAECHGKVAGPKGAAAKLGIPRSTLDSKITQLKIKKHRFMSDQ